MLNLKIFMKGTLGSDGFTMKYPKLLRRKYHFYKKTLPENRQGILPTPFYDTSFTLTPNPEALRENENLDQCPHMYIIVKIQNNIEKSTPAIHKRDNATWPIQVSPSNVRFYH